MKSIKETINIDKLPKHIAIIMDGNGRWAKQRGKVRIFGHRNAVKTVRTVVEAAAEINIKYLTLYTFSIENWNRPKIEVDSLMSLLVSSLKSETETFMKNNVQLIAIGKIDDLPLKVKAELNKTIEITSKNDGMKLILALNYSSRWEITNAVKLISNEVCENKIKAEDINENLIEKYLLSYNIPDPELLIRTSGEYRISNFLLWQIAYTELYFTEKLWPDFSKEDFHNAIINFQTRERRFGMTSEQLSNN